MRRRVLLASARVPDTRNELRLYQSGDLFSIDIAGQGELMSSRMHGSERALAELACAHIPRERAARLLVGGLGLGFTLAAALDAVGPDAQVLVAELVPEVVEWSRGPMGAAAGHPLVDTRVDAYVGDVCDLVRAPGDGFDAIMLDVDNGPEALLRRENDWLYSAAGLQALRRALRPGGVLAVWSASPHARFGRRLREAGLRTEEKVVRGHRPGKGARHHIWVAS